MPFTVSASCLGWMEKLATKSELRATWLQLRYAWARRLVYLPSLVSLWISDSAALTNTQYTSLGVRRSDYPLWNHSKWSFAKKISHGPESVTVSIARFCSIHRVGFFYVKVGTQFWPTARSFETAQNWILVWWVGLDTSWIALSVRAAESPVKYAVVHDGALWFMRGWCFVFIHFVKYITEMHHFAWLRLDRKNLKLGTYMLNMLRNIYSAPRK